MISVVDLIGFRPTRPPTFHSMRNCHEHARTYTYGWRRSHLMQTVSFNLWRFPGTPRALNALLSRLLLILIPLDMEEGVWALLVHACVNWLLDRRTAGASFATCGGFVCGGAELMNIYANNKPNSRGPPFYAVFGQRFWMFIRRVLATALQGLAQ